MIAPRYDGKEEIFDLVRSVYGRDDIDFSTASAIGVMEDGKLIAGVVFHDWNPDAGTIELSIASKSSRWLRRPIMAALARYVIVGAVAQLVVMRTAASNKRACRIAEAIGFTPHVIPRLRGRDDAEVIYTMTAEALETSPFTRFR